MMEAEGRDPSGRDLKRDPAFPKEYKDFEERIMPFGAGVAHDSKSQIWITWAVGVVVLITKGRRIRRCFASAEGVTRHPMMGWRIASPLPGWVRYSNLAHFALLIWPPWETPDGKIPGWTGGAKWSYSKRSGAILRPERRLRD